MPAYNGHRSWNAWNVALWVQNDEGLYALARDCYRDAGRSLDRAAQMMIEIMRDTGTVTTPDGAPFNPTNVKAAIAAVVD